MKKDTLQLKTEYYGNGFRHRQYYVNKRGLYEGKLKYWYENSKQQGPIAGFTTFKNGIVDGLCKCYDRGHKMNVSSKLCEWGFYKNSKIFGQQRVKNNNWN